MTIIEGTASLVGICLRGAGNHFKGEVKIMTPIYELVRKFKAGHFLYLPVGSPVWIPPMTTNAAYKLAKLRQGLSWRV